MSENKVIEFAPFPKVNNFVDKTGQKFTRLTVVGYLGKSYWWCSCDCGNQLRVKTGDLNNGHNKSCGCWSKDINPKFWGTHRKTNTKVYKCWYAMRQRCEKPNIRAYTDYGGRGIKVCDRWQKFENFYADMGEPPTKEHSIERIDVNGDYCPENCKWATNIEQHNNRRDNRFITFEGRSQTIADWCRELTLNHKTIRERLRIGWSVEKSLTTPIRHHKK